MADYQLHEGATVALDRELAIKVDSPDIDVFRVMTAAAYAALTTKDARTIYAIRG